MTPIAPLNQRLVHQRSGAFTHLAGLLLLTAAFAASTGCASPSAGGSDMTAEVAPTVKAAFAHPPGLRVNPPTPDPRVGLAPGLFDAAEAIWNLRMVSATPPPEAFVGQMNSDLAFTGDYAIQGNFDGIQVWDISDPANPVSVVSYVCPASQSDVSVYDNLLFVSGEDVSARLDCSDEGVQERVSHERLRGIRIFDITDIADPQYVANVQTCRGSHTHTVLKHPGDDDNVYIYVSGSAPVRPAEELAGCSSATPDEDPNSSRFRIEVIRVPLDNIGLAGGACGGYGLLLDISDPANPVRLAAVADSNFAYWHSATFNNDGTAIMFTDEWGGGGGPKCRADDPMEWGANAVFTIEDGEMVFQSYYKMPAPQTTEENCVAHNGSLIPVPGRDIMIQGWYQGGISLIDWTDPANPVEIAYHDRGPINPDRMVMGGSWSVYWYNGLIVNSEIARGLDIFELVPSDILTRNEIDAANSVRLTQLNSQGQPVFEWPATFALAKAYLDQLERWHGMTAPQIASARAALAAADSASGSARRDALRSLAGTLSGQAAGAQDSAKVEKLIDTVQRLADGG